MENDAMMECPYCLEEMPEGKEACPHCGREVVEDLEARVHPSAADRWLNPWGFPVTDEPVWKRAAKLSLATTLFYLLCQFNTFLSSPGGILRNMVIALGISLAFWWLVFAGWEWLQRRGSG
jgi:hypothetical protein